jgi:hypothetical protein
LIAYSRATPYCQRRAGRRCKTIVKGSGDEIHIIVVEGPADHHSSTSKPLGLLRISGAQISRDLLRGTEVDLTFAEAALKLAPLTFVRPGELRAAQWSELQLDGENPE